MLTRSVSFFRLVCSGNYDLLKCKCYVNVFVLFYLILVSNAVLYLFSSHTMTTIFEHEMVPTSLFILFFIKMNHEVERVLQQHKQPM